VEPESFAAVGGQGATGVVQGRALAVGNAALMQEYGIPTAGLSAAAASLADQGRTPMFISLNGTLAGIVAVADPIRPTSREAVARLTGMGLDVVLLTGDNERTARAIASDAGIAQVVAGVMPEGKVAEISRLQEQGRVVAMVGDGINDAPALARADVGIAMGTGTDVAIESASVTLVKGDLRGIVRARRLSRATMRNIRENLFFAFVYNALGVPIAAGVLYPALGLLLSPIVASAAMTFSSVSVIANALRLRRVEL
jgi:Cu+-exporting ATPase